MIKNKTRRRLIIGTLVEYAFIIAAACAVVVLIGYAFGWICDHLPDWSILPLFWLVMAVGAWAIWHDTKYSIERAAAQQARAKGKRP